MNSILITIAEHPFAFIGLILAVAILIEKIGHIIIQVGRKD